MERTFFLLVVIVTATAGEKTFCKAVRKGGQSEIICYFGKDISRTKDSFAVHKFSQSGYFEEILDCQWDSTTVSADLECETKPEYFYVEPPATNFTLQIRNAPEKDIWSYVCQVIPSSPSDLTPCNFTVKDLDDGSASLPDNNGTRTNQNDQAEVIYTSVIVVLLAISGITIGLIVRLKKLQRPFCCQEMETTGVSMSLLDEEQPIFRACKTGDVELVKTLVDSGTEVNVSNTDDDSLLHLAVRYGQRNVVRHLISMGSNVNEKNREMYTPLHLASMYPEQTDDNKIMARLKMSEDEPETPESIIQLLLKARANPESTDNKCRTPLHVACDVHNYMAVKALVGENASINPKDTKDVTPLHLACQNGEEDVLMIIFARQELDVQPKDASLWTPLHYACCYGHTGSAKLLLGAGADIDARESRRWTPLHFACDSGNEALVKMLLEFHANTAVTERKVADIEAKESRRWTPLHFACHSGNEACVKLLLEAGASVGVCEERDRTPLHLACESEAEGVVRLLLEAHADIEATDVNGLRALHVACEKGSARIVKMLIDHDADKKAQTKDGRKPFDIAKRNGHKKTARLLTEHRFCV